MKVAFILHGMAEAMLEYDAWPDRGWETEVKNWVNFRRSLGNYDDTILSDPDVDIDVYFHTWDTKILDQRDDLIRSFDPVDYEIENQTVDSSVRYGTEKAKSRQVSLLKSLRLVVNPSDYDYFILTRFDLHFESSIVGLIKNRSFDDTLYVGFKTNGNHVDDNLFIAPSNQFDDLVKTLKALYKQDKAGHLHRIGTYWQLKATKRVKYLVSGEYSVENNPLYHIVRYVSPIDRDTFKYTWSPEKNLECKYCQN